MICSKLNRLFMRFFSLINREYTLYSGIPFGGYVNDKSKFGRRLLNGVPADDWHAPVGLAGKPLVMTFDFKCACAFNEVDISTRSQKAAVKIEVADTLEGPFWGVFERSRDDSPDMMFHRLLCRIE